MTAQQATREPDPTTSVQVDVPPTAAAPVVPQLIHGNFTITRSGAATISATVRGTGAFTLSFSGGGSFAGSGPVTVLASSAGTASWRVTYSSTGTSGIDWNSTGAWS